MQFPHCAPPDYILFGKNLGAQRYRCQACRRTFQTLRRGKAPPPPSKNRLKSYTSKDWSSEALVEFSSASQNSLPLVCPGCWEVANQPTQDEVLLFY